MRYNGCIVNNKEGKSMTAQVEVLDSIMGSGKTTAIMKWMKKNFTERYIYISPLLTEIEERLQEELPVLVS